MKIQIRHRILLSALAILLGNFTLNAQAELSWHKEKAHDNYPLIVQYELLQLSREYTVSNANKSFLPQFSITGIAGYVDGFPGSPVPGSESGTGDFHLIGIGQLQQMIWDGGITKHRKEIIQLEYEIDSIELDMRLDALDERVEEIFFGLLLMQEQEKSRELILETLKSRLKQLKAGEEEGIVLKTDVQELQIEILRLEQELLDIEYTSEAFRQMMELLTGEPISADQIWNMPAAQDDLLLESKIARKELSILARRSTMSERYMDLSRSKAYPKLALLGVGTVIEPGISFGPSEIGHVLVAGISLNWDIGALYTLKNDRRLSENRIKMIEAEEYTLLLHTEMQLSKEEREWEKYSAMIEKDESIVELKSNIRKAYESKYDNGDCTISDLIQKIQEESLSNQNLILHQIQYNKAIYNYRRLKGI